MLLKYGMIMRISSKQKQRTEDDYMYSDYYDSIAQVAGADPEVAAAMNQEL